MRTDSTACVSLDISFFSTWKLNSDETWWFWVQSPGISIHLLRCTTRYTHAPFCPQNPWSFLCVQTCSCSQIGPYNTCPTASHLTSLVWTITPTCRTKKELDFLSLPFPHTQQYPLHQNRTPPPCSPIPKTKNKLTPTVYYYISTIYPYL